MEKNSRSISNHTIDDKEDLEIKKIAHAKHNSYFFIALVITFLLMIIIAIFNIYSYTKSKNLEDSKNVIEISNDKNRILIINAGEINEKINKHSFSTKDEIVIEKTNTIELFAKKNVLDEEKIFYNVKLKIKDNDFKQNDVSNNKSDLMIRISYSFDNENWVYINNVLETNNRTISPLMGNYYDIAGIESEIKVSIKNELTAKLNESKKGYWKIETIIRNSQGKNLEKKLNMNFYLEYEDAI